MSGSPAVTGQKRPREDQSGDQDLQKLARRPPSCIVSWNIASLRARIERKELTPAIQHFLSLGADAIVLQETQIKAYEKGTCEAALRSAGLGKDWQFHWTFHPTRRSCGVALLVHSSVAPLSVRTDWRTLADSSLKYGQPLPPGVAAASGVPPFTSSTTATTGSAFTSGGSSVTAGGTGGSSAPGRSTASRGRPSKWRRIHLQKKRAGGEDEHSPDRRCLDESRSSDEEEEAADEELGEEHPSAAEGKQQQPQDQQPQQGLQEGVEQLPGGGDDDDEMVAGAADGTPSKGGTGAHGPGSTSAPSGSTGWQDPEGEGRLLLAEYPGLWMMCLYVPCCSWYAPGHARREIWDYRMASVIRTLQAGRPAGGEGTSAANGTGSATTSGTKQGSSAAAGPSKQGTSPHSKASLFFMPASKRRELEKAAQEAEANAPVQGKPVLVVGDLNVCPTDLDVSHPEFFAAAMKPLNVGSAGHRGLPGQPGFTTGERLRYEALLIKGAGLVDTWRELHPTERRLTWGWGPLNVRQYSNKQMGLDFFLVSRSLWQQGVVQSSEVMGYGKEATRGSDHVPVIARFDWSKQQPVSTPS